MRDATVITTPHFVILNGVKDLTQGVERAESLFVPLAANVRSFAVCAAQDDKWVRDARLTKRAR